MKDDLTDTRNPEPHRVHLTDDDELSDVGDRLGVSHDLVKPAVDDVGTSARRVEEWLQHHR